MAPRLVLCFRSRLACEEGKASELPAMLRDLSGRSAVRGGQLIAWHGDGVAFSFPVDALPDLTDMLPEPPCTRFGMGLAVGELDTVMDLGHGAAAALGPPLVEATALAALAESGEALVSPALASRETELLAAEAKTGSHGGQHWRGLILNLAQPWLPAPADTLSRLDFDAWVGASPITRFPLRTGSRSVLVADEGSGGTRFLRELAGPERRVLWIAPAAAGEPLGALRRAFSRDTAWSRTDAPGHAARGALERLLSGAGLTHEAALTLLRLWATTGRGSGPAIVAVDEADRVDTDTLEAVGEAARDAFAVAVRTHGPALPEALRRLPSCVDLELDALDGQQAVERLGAFTGGALHGPLAERWARLAGFSPLGLQEALCCALEEGELVWAERDLVAFRSGPNRSAEQDASYWIRRRLDRFDAAERAVLDAVAVLGGEADSHELTAVADHVLGSGKSLADVTRQLVGRRWVCRTGERILGLVSATHRRVLLEAMSGERRKHWHSLVVKLVGSRDRPLSAGMAALHALLAGQDDQAEASARRVALLLRVNAREVTARAFDSLADDLTLESVCARGLGGSLVVVGLDDPSAKKPEPVVHSTGSGASASSSEEGETDFDLEDWMPGMTLDGPATVGRTDGVKAPAAPGESRPVADAAAEASTSAEPWSREGSCARDVTVNGGCRQHLALSLLFARGERFVEALPHALQALAIARETGDARGEKACVMTLAALSRAAGQPAAAVAWEQRLRA